MEEMLKKPDKKRSSILKKPTDHDTSDTDTKTKLMRRISFSGKKSVKEFIQDEDKNTVWGTSYEESAESNMPLNNSSPKTKGRKDDLNFTVEMDIEPEFVVPLCPINPMNKENETPDNTISASINMGRKVPLASSTMLMDALPLATPPRKKNPFSWLKDPVIVGATQTVGDDSDETGSAEATFNYVPSPMSVSLMNRDTTCFEVSSLHLEEHKRRSKVKKTGKLLQEMDISACQESKKATGVEVARKTIYFTTEPDQMSLTGTCERSRKVNQMELTMPGSLISGENECMAMSMEEDVRKAETKFQEIPEAKRKTVYFPEENNQMDFTVEQEVSGRESQLDAGLLSEKGKKSGTDQMAITEMSLCLEDAAMSAGEKRQSVFFPLEDNQMSMTETLQSNPTGKETCQKSRKTVYFPPEENQMNLTGYPGQNPIHEMSLCSKDQEDAVPKDRKTIYFPCEDNQMDMTGRPGGNHALEMSLAPQDPVADAKRYRRTVYFPPEENQMNFTKLPEQECDGECAKIAQTIFFPTEENQMKILEIPQDPPGKSTRKNRQSVYFTEEDNQMDMTALPEKVKLLPKSPRDRDNSHQKNRETVYFAAGSNQMNVTGVSGANPALEMSISAPDPEKNVQKDRKTIYFPPEENQMNVTEAVDQNRELDMSFSTQNYEKTSQRSRKTVFFPPDEDQMNITDITGKVSSLDVTLGVEDHEKKDKMDLTGFCGKSSPLERENAEKSVQNSRKTVYFPDQNNQMNITEISEREASVPEVAGGETKEMEENPIIGGARKKIRTSVARISPFCRRESTGDDENPSSSPSLYLNEGLETLPMDMSLGEGAYGGRIDETVKSLGLELSEDNTMKICEALHREQRRHRTNFSIDNSRDLTRFLEDEAPDMKMLMEESYVEANSLISNPLSSNEKANYNDSIVKLSNVRVPRSIRRETYTIQRHSKIPIPESRIPTPDQPRCSSASHVKPSETLVSLHDVEEEEVPKIPEATAADNSESLENFLESDLYGKIVESRDIVKSVREPRDRTVALHRKVEPLMEFFKKYPSRCQLPRCPSFKELIHNVVNTCCRSIWFIDLRMEDGWLMFKHRKITTFEIWMKFDRKQLRDMDSVNSRGKLTFKRINIRDTNWYTNADPATKSKIWIYLHTKFRTQVLSDSYLLGKYYDSNTLRDFLQYIDQLCCDIYAARPHILDIIRMYR